MQQHLITPIRNIICSKIALIHSRTIVETLRRRWCLEDCLAFRPRILRHQLDNVILVATGPAGENGLVAVEVAPVKGVVDVLVEEDGDEGEMAWGVEDVDGAEGAAQEGVGCAELGGTLGGPAVVALPVGVCRCVGDSAHGRSAQHQAALPIVSAEVEDLYI